MRLPNYRYGIVLALTTTVALFRVLAPEGHVAGAISLALLGTLLSTVIWTGGAIQIGARRGAATAVAAGAAVAAVLTGFDLIPTWLYFAIFLLLILGTYPELGLGLIRLIRARGVTVQGVSGSLALYLLFGLTFAAAIDLMAAVTSPPFFAQGFDGTVSDHVYFSFSVLTTVGFGDLTAATRAGRALAVFEVLVGQIYLVTVIALLVGNLRHVPLEPKRKA